MAKFDCPGHTRSPVDSRPYERLGVDAPSGRPPASTRYNALLSTSAAIGSFLFGYDTGIVSAAMLYVPRALGFGYHMEELIISITLGFCAVAAVCAGAANDRFGRRPVIMAAALLFLLSSVVLAAAVNVIMLLIGRSIVGVAIGLASMTIPPYLAECAPKHVRGQLVVIVQLMITFGQFAAAFLGAVYSYISPYSVGWRLMLGTAAFPAILQFVVFLKLPESPRWLMARGREEQATTVLNNMYGGNSEWVEYELAEMRQQGKRDKKVAKSARGVLLEMLTRSTVRRALLIGCALHAFQQLVGINTVMYYTATIIQMAGLGHGSQAIWLSCVVAFTNFAFTFIPYTLIERVGRRKLLLISNLGAVIALFILGGSMLWVNKTSPTVEYHLNTSSICSHTHNCDDCVTYEQCGFCYRIDEQNAAGIPFGWCLPTLISEPDHSRLGNCSVPEELNTPQSHWAWNRNYCPQSSGGTLVVLAMMLVSDCPLVAFSIGLGPMAWLIAAEIFPTWARSTGVAITTAVNWICNLIVSLTFLNLTEALGKHGAFFLYAGFGAFSLVLFYLIVPETTGVQIEEVEALFDSKPKRRYNGGEVMPTQNDGNGQSENTGNDTVDEHKF